MTGTTKSGRFSFESKCQLTNSHRVRQNIREGHPDFPVTSELWPAFLYPHAKGDQTNIAEDLLRSALLVKVSAWLYLDILSH